MPSVPDLLRDPEFRKLSPDAQLYGLQSSDADFAKLSQAAQMAALEDPQFHPGPAIPGTEKTGLPGVPTIRSPKLNEVGSINLLRGGEERKSYATPQDSAGRQTVGSGMRALYSTGVEGLGGLIEAAGQWTGLDPVKTLGAAVGSVGKTAAEAWFQGDTDGKDFIDDPNKLLDPGYLGRLFGGAVGSMGGIMGTGAGTAGAATRAAKFLKLSEAAAKRAALTGGVAGASLAEVFSQSGHDYYDALSNGASADTAAIVAAKSAGLSIGPTLALNAAGYWNPNIKGAARRQLLETFGEVAQEEMQQAASNVAAREYDPNRPALQGGGEAALGALVASGVGEAIASGSRGAEGQITDSMESAPLDTQSVSVAQEAQATAPVPGTSDPQLAELVSELLPNPVQAEAAQGAIWNESPPSELAEVGSGIDQVLPLQDLSGVGVPGRSDEPGVPDVRPTDSNPAGTAQTEAAEISPEVEEPAVPRETKAKGELSEQILETAAKVEPQAGMLVTMRQLREELGDDVPKAEFDATVLDLAKQGKLTLAEHSDPLHADLGERETLIRTEQKGREDPVWYGGVSVPATPAPLTASQKLRQKAAAAKAERKAKLTRKPAVPLVEAAPIAASAAAVTKAPGWYETLAEPQRESLFSRMRAIDGDIDRANEQYRKLAPRGGEIEVGGGAFDEFLKADSARELLSGINRGKDIDTALADAKLAARYAIGKWNKKRGNDYQTQRWEGSADSKLDHYARVLREAVAQPEPTKEPGILKRLATDETGSVDLGKVSKNVQDAYDVIVKPLGTRMRESSERLGVMMDRARDTGDVIAGGFVNRVIDAKLPKLNRAERFELLDHLEGQGTSKNPKILDAAKVVRGLTDDVAGIAVNLGVQLRTSESRGQFVPMDNYFPHVFRRADAMKSGPVRQDIIENLVRRKIRPDEKTAGAFLDEYVDFLENGKPKQQLIDHLVQSGKAKDPAAALGLLRSFRQSTRRHGSLEYAREVDLPFYDPDPARVLPWHMATAGQRLAQIATFGQDDQAIKKELGEIAKAGGNDEEVRRWVDRRLKGVEDGDTAEERVSRFVRSVQTLKLGLAFIPNATQPLLNVPVAGDFRALAAGYKALFSEQGRRFAVETGAAIEPVLHESHQSLGAGRTGRTAETILKPFQAVEQSNRIIAANAGAEMAGRLFNTLKSKPLSRRARWARHRLADLGINTQAALQRGSLTRGEILMAGKKFSDLTQFRSRPEEMPVWASTWWGKIVGQFKTFAYNQSRFVLNETIGELTRGEPLRAGRNVLLMAGLAGGLGELVRVLRNGISQRDEEPEGLERYAKNLGAVGAGGIALDAIRAVEGYRELEWAAGPAASMGVDLGQLGWTWVNPEKTLDEKVEKTKKVAIRHMPFGQVVRGAVEARP